MSLLCTGGATVRYVGRVNGREECPVQGCRRLFRKGRSKSVRGLSLLEVLIAISIFSIASLAIAAAIVNVLHIGTTSRALPVVSAEANAIIERILSLPYSEVIQRYSQGVTIPSSVPATANINDLLYKLIVKELRECIAKYLLSATWRVGNQPYKIELNGILTCDGFFPDLTLLTDANGNPVDIYDLLNSLDFQSPLHFPDETGETTSGDPTGGTSGGTGGGGDPGSPGEEPSPCTCACGPAPGRAPCSVLAATGEAIYCCESSSEGWAGDGSLVG